MGRVTFILPDGSETVIEVSPGTSLMRAATGHGLAGIFGDCGGMLACSTCHVVVDPDFAAKLPAPERHEDEMLDFTAMPRESNSRLSCQIVMHEKLDGITVRVADPQL